MSELIVIGYGSPEKAEEVRNKLLELQGEYMIDLADAVVATVDKKGRIKLNQLVHVWAIGASYGSFWGLLIGLLFLHPLLGVLVGAGTGLITGALSDYGLNDDFMKKVAGILRPGQAALFVFARHVTGDRIVSALAPFGGTVIRTNLNTVDEKKLRDAFQQVQAGAANQLRAADKARKAS
ncbi:MAG: DUF1269 domain-containing protein [Hyphomicrobium sp.]|jgi:uncharacterized membrane protein|nr:DUF1269 domain-containing protein [Hyphomicrobium sp.]